MASGLWAVAVMVGVVSAVETTVEEVTEAAELATAAVAQVAAEAMAPGLGAAAAEVKAGEAGCGQSHKL